MGRRQRKRQQPDAAAAVRSPGDADPAPSIEQFSVQQRQTWQGPLPPPEVLQAFRDAVPRADEVILSEYEKQGEHRRSTETRESGANAFAIRALSLGTVLTSVATVGGGIYLAALGHVWGAGIVIAGPLVTVILNRSRSSET